MPIGFLGVACARPSERSVSGRVAARAPEHDPARLAYGYRVSFHLVHSCKKLIYLYLRSRSSLHTAGARHRGLSLDDLYLSCAARSLCLFPSEVRDAAPTAEQRLAPSILTSNPALSVPHDQAHDNTPISSRANDSSAHFALSLLATAGPTSTLPTLDAKRSDESDSEWCVGLTLTNIRVFAEPDSAFCSTCVSFELRYGT